MTTPDVPATERERDELRESIAGEVLRSRVGVPDAGWADGVADRILALLAPQERVMSEHMRCAQPGCGAQIACVLCGEPVAAPASGEPSVVREALDALRKNREGWLNTVELRLLPRQHEHTAYALADESFAATLKLERLLAAPGVPEEGAGDAE